MLARRNVLRLLSALAVFTLLVASCGTIPEQLPEQGPPGEGDNTPEGPAPTQPPEPEATEPPPEPEPTQPPPEPEPTTPPPEPEPTTPPAEPQPTTAPPPEEPPAEGQPSWNLGQLLLGGIGLAVVVGIVIGVVAFFVLGRRGEEEAPAELPSVPITSLVADIKAGRVSKIRVVGETVTITRIDGLVMVSRKEAGSDLVQLLTNLGVTPEMMSSVVIEVQAPETPPS